MHVAVEGLEDVVAGTSAICTVDGRAGRLIYRGYDIGDLAENASFEEVIALLWDGELPTQAQLDQLKKDLGENRAIPGALIDQMRGFPKNTHPLHVLRTIVSAASMYDPEVEDISPEASRRKAIRLTGLVSGIVATWHRIRNGEEPVEPDPSMSVAGNFLYQLWGEKPRDVYEKTMNVSLILHADHELNASTFTGRVIAATLSDMHSAMSGAIGALKGPLHGGANEGVIKMLEAIGTLERTEPWLMDAFARKERIMGFGHRVYKVEDPRARQLRRMSQQIGQDAGDTKWYDISEKVREIVKREKGLEVNVDFYSASTYYSMGIQPDLYTPIFAVSRVVGWTAHVMEQYAHNRLIRPRAEYIGAMDKKYAPIADRG